MVTQPENSTELTPPCEPFLCHGPSWSWVIILAIAGIAIIVLAVWRLDGPVAQWVHDHGIDIAFRKRGTWTKILSATMKTPGESYFAVLAAIAALALDPRRWRAGLFVALAALSSASNTIAKWILGRQRPLRDDVFHPDSWSFQPFRGGLPGLIHPANLSFPSGHACQAFAVATAICMLYPRRGWLAIFPALMVAAERVLSNSHYISEVTAGALLGALGTLVVGVLVRRFCFPQNNPPGVPLGQ